MNAAKSISPDAIKLVRRGLLLVWTMMIVLTVNLTAGVLVAPTVVFLSDANRTGRLNIQNPTAKPVEVSIHFGFGLPVSDSLGNVRVALQDSAITDPRSAMEWVKAFPRKVILPPNGAQVVRLLARPPENLADGEYWARVIVRSEEGETSIPVAGEDDKITTKLNMIVQQAIMLKYRTGQLNAKLELKNADAKAVDSQVEVMLNLANRGNVSYLGILQCRLLDADNREIDNRKIDLAVYRDMKRRVDFEIPEGDFKVPYSVDLLITSKGRNDIPDEDMIFGNDITWSMVLE